MPSLSEVLTSRIKQAEAQLTGMQTADISSAVINLAALQVAAAGATNIRDRAIRVEQTINSSGSVVTAKYFMLNGDTIEDTFTYGANSLTEPILVIRGNLVLALTTVSMVNFTVLPNGTTINYTVVGAPVTELTGSLNINGVELPLTHVSSGVAAVATPILVGQPTSVTISRSIPALTAPITAVSVSNNSLRTIQRSLTWTTTTGATVSGDKITLSAAGNGSIASPAINSANYFEIIASVNSFAEGAGMVAMLDDDALATYTWSVANTFVLSNYITPSANYAVGENGGSNLVAVPSIALPIKMKLHKSGNDLVASTSSDNGTTWIVRYTKIGALVTSPVLYLKTLLTSGTAKSIDIQLFS